MCSDPEENINIAMISTGKICHCDKKVENPASGLENSNSYTNEMFFIEYTGNHHQSYNNNEHIYDEIGENTSDRAGTVQNNY